LDDFSKLLLNDKESLCDKKNIFSLLCPPTSITRQGQNLYEFGFKVYYSTNNFTINKKTAQIDQMFGVKGQKMSEANCLVLIS
jgi:hypothetical protein